MSNHYSVSIISNQRSLRITLPKEVVREKGWKKGDKLSLVSEDDRIILKEEKRSEQGKPTAYSIGYEGKDLEKFLCYLKENKVRQLIDVRKNAFSYKAGFSKTPLRESLDKVGITYVHLPQLGTDSESRKEYKATGDIEKLFETYEQKLNQSMDSLDMLKALVNFKTSALMCFEDDFTQCHRSIIENRLKDDSISVVHLCNGKQKGSF